MKTITISLLLAFLVVGLPARAAEEAPKPPQSAWQKAWANSSCRRSIIAAASVAAVSLSSWGYYNAFNFRFPEGTWKNEGSDSTPVWVPEIKGPLQITERIPSLSIPRERTLWVHDGQNGYGKIFFRRDRIEHYRGKELVAKSNWVAPESRPYDKEHPISVCVFDAHDRLVGTIVETTEETSFGQYAVEFSILNEKGVPVARSATFSENGKSQRLAGPWQIDFPEEDLSMTRRGWISKTYTWKRESRPEEPVDPRLLIFLSALKSYVEEFRR